MPGAGKMKDRVRLQRRGLDDNGDRLGEWQDVGSAVSAELTWLRGTEAVMQARLQGRQPVVIAVRDMGPVRGVDNTWRALDARKPSRVFNISSAAPGDPGFLNILAEMVVGHD